jgi:hypothetical protein
MRDSMLVIGWWYIDTVSCWDDPVHAFICENMPNGGWFEIDYYLKENVIVCGNMSMYMDPNHKRIMTLNPSSYKNYNKKLFDAEKAVRDSVEKVIDQRSKSRWYYWKGQEETFWDSIENNLPWNKLLVHNDISEESEFVDSETVNFQEFDFCTDTCTFWFSAEQYEVGHWLWPPAPDTYFKGQLYSECKSTIGKRPNWDDAVCLGNGTFRDVVINGVQQCKDIPTRFAEDDTIVWIGGTQDSIWINPMFENTLEWFDLMLGDTCDYLDWVKPVRRSSMY